MSGPPPNPTRRRRNKPAGGEWKPAPGVGWQHGPIPDPPDGLLASSRETWASWFKGWWAVHWSPDYLAQVRKAIQIYDATERGDFKVVSELRQWMDGIGVTFKGQQMLRWQPPTEETQKSAAAPAENPYGHLRIVNE